MREVVGGLEGQGWIAADYDTEEVFLLHFIRLDASRQPQIYVAACRAIQAAQSPELQQAAWQQVQTVGVPKLKRDPLRKPETAERLKRQQHDAYEDLREFMERQTEAFPNPSRRVPAGSVEEEAEEEGGGEGEEEPNRTDPVGLCTNGCDSPAGFSAPGSGWADGAFCEDCAAHGGVAPQWR